MTADVVDASEGVRRCLAVIPTYNESASLPLVIARLRGLAVPPDVLVVDDASPDGTGRIAGTLANADNRVQVVHRGDKRGLGTAYLDGFAWAFTKSYDVIIQMDADGSHQPEQLPRLLSAIDMGADLAIGSRWVTGGAIINWPWYRMLLSRAGTRYTRWALRLGIHDATGGFRAWRTDALQRLELGTVSSQGYCFQIDMALRARDAALTVAEVPITFVERQQGTSKMSARIVCEAIWRVTRWGLRRLRQRVTPVRWR